MIRRRLSQLLSLLLAVAIGTGPLSCRNPAVSELPPSAVAPPGTPFPPLPKGDLYFEETVVDPDATIDPGDTLEVVIRRGAGEEKVTSVVRESGIAAIAFVEVQVRGLTAAQAEALIQERVSPFFRNPRVQIILKKRSAKLKRVFVFGDVKKPGMVPMSRNMTVMQAVAAADNYNETAFIDQIRVIRGNLNQPQILTADLARLFTYGDLTMNVALQENDVIYVPRETLGDAAEAAKKLMPIVFVSLAPVYALFVVTLFTPTPLLAK